MTDTFFERNKQHGIPIFSNNGLVSPERSSVSSEIPYKHREYCPICEKRAFDVSNLESGNIGIELKCPHCRNIVLVPIRDIKQ